MKKKIIIAIVIFLVLALGVGSYFLFFNKDEDDKKTSQKEEKITITFDTDGGSKVEDMKVKKGSSFSLPQTTKEGYVFLGWYNGSTAYTDDTTNTIKKNIVLTAKWEEVTAKDVVLTVTFDSKGGSKVKDMTFKCDDGAATLKNLPKSKKDAYNFMSWEDKHGKSILDGASIVCEGKEPTLKLYATWEYDGPVANPEQDPDASKTYTCPDGYKLNQETKKCTIEGTVTEKCPSDTKVDGSLCIKTSDYNTGTRVCKEWTVSVDGKGHTSTESTGDFYMVGNSSSSYGKCAYHKWVGISQSECNQSYQGTSKKVTWVSELHACYAETKVGNYDTACAENYKYYSSSELSSKFGIHNNGGCLRKVAKEKKCSDGYVLTDNKCIKTVDATAK